MKFLSFLCTKWMVNCEAMTSSTHSFAYSYGLVKKCFLKICETSKFHNFLIFQPTFIRFSLFCSENFTLSSEIKLRSAPDFPFNCLVIFINTQMCKTDSWTWVYTSSCANKISRDCFSRRMCQVTQLTWNH